MLNFYIPILFLGLADRIFSAKRCWPSKCHKTVGSLHWQKWFGVQFISLNSKLTNWMYDAGPILLIMEFAHFGSLRNFLHKCRDSTINDGSDPSFVLTNKDLLCFGWQIARGMEYLCQKKVNFIMLVWESILNVKPWKDLLEAGILELWKCSQN